MSEPAETHESPAQDAAAASPPPPPTPPADDSNALAEVPKEAKTMGMLCHLLALAGVVIPFPGANVLGPLIIWLIKKDEMPFVDDQGKESLNFQITVLIAAICCLPLILVFGLGLLLLFGVGIAALVLVIIASVKASEGVTYRYPFALRLIK